MALKSKNYINKRTPDFNQRFIRGRIVQPLTQRVAEGDQWVPIRAGRQRLMGVYYLSDEEMATFLFWVLQPSWGSVMQHFCCRCSHPQKSRRVTTITPGPT